MSSRRLIRDAPTGAAVATAADMMVACRRRLRDTLLMRQLKAQARKAGTGHPVADLILSGQWRELDALCDELYGPLDGGEGAR